MKKFVYGQGIKKRRRVAFILGICLVLALFISAGIVRKSYQDNLKPLNSSKTGVIVTVDPGSVPSEIAKELKEKGLIKSDWAFEWYVRNHNVRTKLKAGTYLFNPSQSVPEIVDQIVAGKVATDLVTILPAQRIDQLRASFIKAGFSEKNVDAALNPEQYKAHPALTDKPKDASLEGYLYPESFQKTAETTPQEIIKLSLDEMQRALTPEIREGLVKQGLSVHQGVILSSIVEQEVGIENDRPIVAQVFLKRLNEDKRLESNATDKYAKIDPSYDSYKQGGLPPGPIGNVSKSSLSAVAFPSETDWLYFVSGDDGKTHFSKTLEEHEALTEKYCTELCP